MLQEAGNIPNSVVADGGGRLTLPRVSSRRLISKTLCSSSVHYALLFTASLMLSLRSDVLRRQIAGLSWRPLRGALVHRAYANAALQNHLAEGHCNRSVDCSAAIEYR